MKYCLGNPEGEPEGFPEGSGDISCFDLIHIFLGGVDTYFITLGHFSFEYGNFWCFGEVLFPPFSLLTKIKCVLLNGRIP